MKLEALSAVEGLAGAVDGAGLPYWGRRHPWRVDSAGSAAWEEAGEKVDDAGEGKWDCWRQRRLVRWLPVAEVCSVAVGRG